MDNKSNQSGKNPETEFAADELVATKRKVTANSWWMVVAVILTVASVSYMAGLLVAVHYGYEVAFLAIAFGATACAFLWGVILLQSVFIRRPGLIRDYDRLLEQLRQLELDGRKA